MKPLWLRALPYVLFALVALASLCAAGYTGWHIDNLARQAEVAQLKDQQHQALATIDQTNRKQLQQATDQAAADKHQADADMAALDTKYTKELNDARKKSAADVAAVRDGTLRVRDRFTCDGASGAGGAAAPAGNATGVGDAAAPGGLRQQDAAILIGWSDEADEVTRQLSACQEIVSQDRQQPTTPQATTPATTTPQP